MEKYQAIQMIKNGSPEDSFRIVQVERRALGPQKVRIAVEASGINFAEVLARQGLYPEAPRLPYVPGYEVVGTVVEAASDVKEIKVGDRVLSGCRFDGYASEVTVPAFYAMRIDDKMDVGTALSLVTQGQTAVYLFEHALRVYPEDLVLVQAAASGVGILLCQLALHRGCRVIATCGSPSKVDYLKKLGVTHVINYRESDFVDEIRLRFPKERLDVVFDSLGGSTLRRSNALLGAGGRLATYGVAEASGSRFIKKLALAKTALAEGVFSPISLLARSKSIAGVNLLPLLKHKPHISRLVYERAYDLLQEGVLRPEIGGIFPANDIAKAHRLMEERKVIGKVALTWN